MTRAAPSLVLVLAAGFALSGCGFALDVSRLSGPRVTFGIERSVDEADLAECRLSTPIYLSGAEPRMRHIERSFRFRGVERTVAVEVDMNLVEASRAIGTERCLLSRFRFDDFYGAVLFDPSEEPFFEALLDELRAVRDDLGLDASGYAELMTAFVQSLEYETGDWMPKHPIAAFVDARGDCDERSALLAGLLAREGYAVALMLFLDAQHMAVGIRVPDIDYRSTGYAFIETTVGSYIGYSPWGARGPTPDLLVRFGDGDAVYEPNIRQRFIALAVETAISTIDDWDGDDAQLERIIRLIAVQYVVAGEPDLDEAYAEIQKLLGTP